MKATRQIVVSFQHNKTVESKCHGRNKFLQAKLSMEKYFLLAFDVILTAV